MKLNKEILLKQVIERLERELNTHQSAAQEAREAATHEESKAENKYDTRGLEASYLAAGQSRRVAELREIITLLNKCEIKAYPENTPVGVFALVTADIEERGERTFFLVPRQGGEALEQEGQEVFTLSLESPLGRRFMGRKVGEVFEFISQGQNREYEILSIQ